MFVCGMQIYELFGRRRHRNGKTDENPAQLGAAKGRGGRKERARRLSGSDGENSGCARKGGKLRTKRGKLRTEGQAEEGKMKREPPKCGGSQSAGLTVLLRIRSFLRILIDVLHGITLLGRDDGLRASGRIVENELPTAIEEDGIEEELRGDVLLSVLSAPHDDIDADFVLLRLPEADVLDGIVFHVEHLVYADETFDVVVVILHGRGLIAQVLEL